ncbi:glycosyltransferase family 4 protein [Kineothrix sp. MB12-C1]|uniref:glycosyltransferase family 4 protein n=1 Tax=Kineothrix sp. MB12-C1 TaxID=3070215 RepID=UPI0027D27A08|nr:glycosyltransferase family 4 protein [Kineothrix sp. MB12-C1]WMC91649.1 glycosyltransferase family 4 protein [Kineothrix sp. MB12-C1]
MGTILILANSSGGLYDFRNELLVRLLEHHRVVISLPDQTKVKELREEGCEIIETPINRRGVNPKEDLKLLIAYRKLMKSIKPDMVITYTIKPNIYGGFACRMTKVPYITTITGLGGAFDKKGLFLKMIVHMYRAGLKKAECIFFQNDENRRIFEGYRIAGKKERRVNGSGVNLQRHYFEAYPGEGKTTFLFVGRVMKERGILEYLEAAVRLHQEDVEFAILGYCDEDYQEMLDEYAQKGIISQWGFHTEVHPYLAKANVIVVASFHEGMSNALIEAAATGRPVIASDISGCKEAFEEGVTGFGFTPGNADDLIRAMEKFLALSKEEQAHMGKAAREKMECEFDRKSVIDAYISEINEQLLYHS